MQAIVFAQRAEPGYVQGSDGGDDSIRWWVRTYVVVPLVASAAAVGLASVDPLRMAPGPVRYVGLIGLVAGLALVAWTVLTYSWAGETLSPVVEPDRLVTAGPLAWTRNPLYLGVVTAVVGVAVLAGSPVAGAYGGLLAVVYHAIVVVVEEPKLEAAFGDEYRNYREAVPRWLPLGRD
jgi:protein-S-isoprenylcysteine O-methyltransferase Ste14